MKTSMSKNLGLLAIAFSCQAFCQEASAQIICKSAGQYGYTVEISADRTRADISTTKSGYALQSRQCHRVSSPVANPNEPNDFLWCAGPTHSERDYEVTLSKGGVVGGIQG